MSNGLTGQAVSTDAASESAPLIQIRDVNHDFRSPSGVRTRVLQDVSLDIPAGQFVALVGPSGCGKTTLMNMVGALLAPQAGKLTAFGSPIGRPDRRMAYMFARDGLLPWRTALRNVTTGLEIRGTPKAEREERAGRLLDMVGLGDFKDVYPSQLSQGMRQRVAIARTLVTDPELILLDEPFAALDAHTRTSIQTEFVRLWEESGSTVVMVTHDLVEAISLADRVVVMSQRPGRVIADIDVPFDRPRDVEEIRFTREFADISSEIWQLLKH